MGREGQEGRWDPEEDPARGRCRVKAWREGAAGMVCARALSSAGLGGEEGPVGEALREGSRAGPEPRAKGQGQETPWGLRTRRGLWILHWDRNHEGF